MHQLNNNICLDQAGETSGVISYQLTTPLKSSQEADDLEQSLKRKDWLIQLFL